MGTNFYVKTDAGEIHIGKRSAAGWYCWDCGTTLCRDGSAGVHTGNSSWHDVCPSCSKSKNVEDLKNSTAGRELGFNKSLPRRKKGVSSCCSFTWAFAPLRFKKLFQKMPGKFIKDEYGRDFSYKEFEQVLKECPLQSTWVNQDFC